MGQVRHGSAGTTADQIVVMNAGRIEQVGTPEEFYERPQTTFVATFIGSPKMNMLGGRVATEAGAAQYGIRPEHIRLSEDGPWPGKVLVAEYLGNETVIHVASEVGTLIVRAPGNLHLTGGAPVRIAPDTAHAHLFCTEGNRI